MASTQVEMERGRIHGLGRGWPAAAGGAESTLAGGESGTATTSGLGSKRGKYAPLGTVISSGSSLPSLGVKSGLRPSALQPISYSLMPAAGSVRARWQM